MSISPSTGSRSPNVLIVEDEPGIAALISFQLSKHDFRPRTVHRGDDALEAIDAEIPDLMVLDRMLPGISGDDVLKTMRANPKTALIPVIMVSAKREESDRIAGLELGADDYISKPFSPRELALRAKALHRRSYSDYSSTPTGDKVLRSGTLRLDGTGTAAVDGEEVHLTPTEFRLLKTLLEHKGRTLLRDQLLRATWGISEFAAQNVRTRTVDMHVKRLRSKLGAAGELLETVRGFGYRVRAID